MHTVKTLSTIFLSAALVGGFAGQCLAQAPKPAAAPVAQPPQRSTFTQPTNPREGRDPFYPDSQRVYEEITAQQHVSAPITSLVVKGFSVVNGRPIVILNNHSFMTGDEGDVMSDGDRVHVHCLDIKPGTVVVEISGVRHEIHF